MVALDLGYLFKAFAAAGATVASIIVFSDNHLLLTAVLIVILCILIASDRRISPIFYILVGIGGLAAETACIYSGVQAWSYRDKKFLGVVPWWLAPMWAIIGGGVLSVYYAAVLLAE